MTSRRRYRKRVRFSRRDDVKDTIHLNDLKREANLDNIWFSQEETQAMISQCRDLVESIESGQPVEEECTRGLECYVPSAKSNRQQIIMEALDAALEELPEEQREVFIWHELEGRSFEEISKMTGQKKNTLISRKRYAVLYLREQLQEMYEEFIID